MWVIMKKNEENDGCLFALMYPVGVAEKGLIEWLRNLFGLPLSSWLLRPGGVVNNPLIVLHNLSC